MHRATEALAPIRFLFALYGSVLRSGRGRDLDGIAFQMWADRAYSLRDVVARLEAATGGTVHVVDRKPNHHTRCWMTLPCGRVVDLQVWCFFPDP